MKTAVEATHTEDQAETQAPELIRIIRKGQWVHVLPSELTDDECRAIYIAAFQIYGGQ